MLRRWLLALALLSIGIVAVTAVLYLFFGLRVRLDGGGTPRPTFVVDAETQADVIARHREAQRRDVQEAVVPAAEPTGLPAISADTPQSPAAGSALASPSPPPAPYWTDFRGPLRDGHYREHAIRTNWPTDGLKPMWKQPVGGGYASFVGRPGSGVHDRAAWAAGSGRRIRRADRPRVVDERVERLVP